MQNPSTPESLIATSLQTDSHPSTLTQTPVEVAPADNPSGSGPDEPPLLFLPTPYDRSYEYLDPDEAELQAELIETLRHISETTFKDSGHATRSVHAKSHGLLHVDFAVMEDLPPVLAQGIFAKAGHYPAVIRLSTVPGDVLDDAVSTPRGMAIKVVGVAGDRLPGTEDDVTQDFILVNSGPEFSAAGAKKFAGMLKLLAATTDKAPGLKKALSAVLQGTEKLIEAVGGKSGTIKALGGHPETHILGETFYSQVPILFGDYMAKVSVVPVSSSLRNLTDLELDLSGKPNGLREAVIDYFRENAAEWELRVQLCTDIEKMPIEDASVVWSEEQSPYIAVARLRAMPQQAWSEELSVAVDDGMAFNPWHAIAAHRPLGSIMRIRQAAYAMSAQYRAEHNGLKQIIEPRNLNIFNDGMSSIM
jgi:hypothetical protein